MTKRKNVAAKMVALTDEAVNSSFSENALKMMRKRYLFTDENGEQETPADMFRRVARNLAEIEQDYGADERRVKQVEGDFYEIMARKEYTPAGRTLTNAGTPQSLI